MAAKLGLVLDCADADKLAEFWSAAIGYTMLGGAGSYVLLVDDTGQQPKLLLQRVDEPKAGKNRRSHYRRRPGVRNGDVPPEHPDKDYKIANLVEVFDEPRAIAWKPGTESPETGELSFGGWIWRYDLEATGPSRTTVTLTYDWSAVPDHIREYLHFPPFAQDHLDNSLQHLSDLVA